MMCFKPITTIFLLCDCFEFPLFVRISFLKECIYRTHCAEYFSKQHSSKRKLENLQRLIHTKTQHPTHHLLTCFFSRPLRTQQYQASSRSIMFSLTAYIIISNLKWPEHPHPDSPQSPQPFKVCLYQPYYHALWFDEKTHITWRLSFHYRPTRNSKLHALPRHFWAALSLLWV